MINLIPVGQLDGGHVAYALFGPAQNRYARRIHRALLVLPPMVGLYYALQALRAHQPWSDVGTAALAGLNWLFLFGLLWFLTRRENHPPTDDDQLSPWRRTAAWLTLVLFVVLFMPAPLRAH
jgi:membrane-associated protease RseP (regulator of RpoE activity)